MSGTRQWKGVADAITRSTVAPCISRVPGPGDCETTWTPRILLEMTRLTEPIAQALASMERMASVSVCPLRVGTRHGFDFGFGVGAGSKLAVTVMPDSTVVRQLVRSMAKHPDQPTKVDPVAGAAVRVTGVPGA